MKNVKVKLVLLCCLLSSLSLMFANLNLAYSVPNYTTYFSEAFTSLDAWAILGDAVLDTETLKVTVTSSTDSLATYSFPEEYPHDFIFTCKLKIGSGTTGETRGLFHIYSWIDGLNQLLFSVVYDGGSSRLYITWRQQGDFINAQHDYGGFTALGSNTWHNVTFAYDHTLGYGWLVIDYSLRLQIPYMVNSTEVDIQGLSDIVLGSYDTSGWTGLTYYDDVLFTSLTPSNSFSPSEDKIVVFWWQILNGYNNLVPPTHIGLHDDSDSLPGYYEPGEDFEPEMISHYNNGARWFIIEAERKTYNSDAETINSFKASYPEATILFWLTENDTYDAHPVQNMTGVDYFIESVYLNRWENYDLYAMYNPIMVMRLYGLENKTIVSLAIDDEHPDSFSHPTTVQFQAQIDFLLEHHPLMPGISYFTWGYLTELKFSSTALLEFVLNDVTVKQLWGKDGTMPSLWYAEPKPFTPFNGSSLGFNHNISLSYTVVSQFNLSSTDAIAVNDTEVYLFGLAPVGNFLNVSINGTEIPNWQFMDSSKIFRITLPSGKAWTINIEISLTYYLPIRFGLGMIGFGLLFVCPIMMVKKFQEHEFEKLLFPWFIGFIFGACLIIGWLFPLGYG